MRMLRRICSKTKKDGIRIEYIEERLGISPIDNKLR